MKIIRVSLDAVEEQMLKQVQRRNKAYKDPAALLKQLIKAEYQKLV